MRRSDQSVAASPITRSTGCRRSCDNAEADRVHQHRAAAGAAAEIADIIRQRADINDKAIYQDIAEDR